MIVKGHYWTCVKIESLRVFISKVFNSVGIQHMCFYKFRWVVKLQISKKKFKLNSTQNDQDFGHCECSYKS